MSELRTVHDTHLDLGANWCLKTVRIGHRASICLLPKGHRGNCLPPRLALRDVTAENPAYVPTPRSES